jgi:hypothetical protein
LRASTEERELIALVGRFYTQYIRERLFREDCTSPMIEKRHSSYHLGQQKDSQDDQRTALATTRMSTQNTTSLPEDKTSIQPKLGTTQPCSHVRTDLGACYAQNRSKASRCDDFVDALNACIYIGLTNSKTSHDAHDSDQNSRSLLL